MRSRLVVSGIVSTFVLTLSGVALSSDGHVSGPVREMDYDVTQDILLGLPDNAPPLTRFERDRRTQHLVADIALFPPNPCDGMAKVWNGVLAAGHLNGEERQRFLAVVLGVMAENQCAAQVVRDDRTNPPRIVSIQPIPNPAVDD